MLALWYCCCVDICVSLWCCSDIIGWQEHCGAVLVLLLVHKSMSPTVAVLWCYCGVAVHAGTKVSEREQILGQRREVWATYPCAPSSTPWYRLWYTLVNTLVHPGIPWYTLWTHLYTLVCCLAFGRICTFLYNATLRIFLTLLILCTWRHNMLFLQ